MLKTRAIPLIAFLIAATVGTWVLYFSFRQGMENDSMGWTHADYHDEVQLEQPKLVAEHSTQSSAEVSKQQTTTSKEISSTSTTTSSPSQCPTQPLGVEQISADFPGDYKNPNNWFRQPGAPNRKEAEKLLTPEEWAILPTFSKLGSHTDSRIAKIESFYGMNTSSNWTWQNHINSLDDEGLAPMTKWVQNFVYNHQHPASCENKTFYVLENKWPKHGLGALIKRVLVELSLAINSNTILVLDPKNSPGNSLVDPSCAKAGRTPSMECVVEDITSCSAYVTKNNTIRELKSEMFRGGKSLEFPPVVQAALMASMEHNGIYPTGAFMRYWWRSQLYGYLMRPRKEVLASMVEMRTNSTLQVGMQLSRQKSGLPKIKSQTLPFPLPPSTMSMHIRHGDKAGEMKITSTRDYIVAAERFLHRNPIIYRKRAFVTTEDPGVIDFLSKTAYINPSQSYGNSDWTWFYSNISRVNGGPQVNLVVNHNKTNAIITHMMQLWMAVECDSFVGNRNSNWNKMIDAVRCTLMDKCRMPYLDPGFVADWEHFP